MKSLIDLADRAWLPDALIRLGIRRLNRMRLLAEAKRHGGRRGQAKADFVETMSHSPVALATDKANDQHYELPAAFFERVLGRHMKYSCGFWNPGVTSLDRSEADMLAITAERAGLGDGMHILELGCGWGSLTLWNALNYPNARITAVSNSASQRRFIEHRCRERGLTNVEVITADMNQFSTDRRFDRILSVEMFEHMRNWESLLARIDTWLKDRGRVFIHIFSHRHYAYPFETKGNDNWMGRYFFTGGMMPSDDLIFNFHKHLVVEKHWRVDGSHYRRTADAWLANMDAGKRSIIPIMAHVYGQTDAALWFQRWRIFFMACSELWGYASGQEWMVSHYLLKKVPARGMTE
ncbi:MAG: cyclopropane-fatty-acyl-phospholipid synthase family protein [Desulfobacteraceae bacterium]|jgi:cyclopropane-fatty-acyl-phospholipid synthase|nr:cyclopropane-fatty-acyl-phospholipid synthase family protein [Desulfobacteraceae bacterium]